MNVSILKKIMSMKIKKIGMKFKITMKKNKGTEEDNRLDVKINEENKCKI